MRHGQTDWNANELVQGWRDTPINQQGIHQAQIAGENLAHEEIETVYSSDLRRARKSAEIVSAALDLPLHCTKRLREMNFGDAEGLKKTDLPAKFPYIYPAFNDLNNPERYDVRYPNGESIGEVQQRFMKFVTKLLDDRRQKVLVVTHGMLVRVFAESCLKKTLRLQNGSVLRVNFDEKSKKFKSPKIIF